MVRPRSDENVPFGRSPIPPGVEQVATPLDILLCDILQPGGGLSPLVVPALVLDSHIMDSPFEWECPTYACHGFITTEEAPTSKTLSVCRPRPESVRPVCGREMVWHAFLGEWTPARPSEGFRWAI